MLDRERLPRAARSLSRSTSTVAKPPATAFESLEPRTLLSTTNTAAATTNLHDLVNGPFSKAGGSLLNVYLAYRTAVNSNKSVAAFNKSYAATATSKGLVIKNATVGVEMQTSGDLAAFVKAMKKQGVVVNDVSTSSKSISAFIPINKLKTISSGSSVSHIVPLVRPTVYQQGSANNQADTALSAALARANYNVDGTGIKIGVISNSVSQVGRGLAGSVASGDLPSGVQVLSDGFDPSDDDEGRAILEEIHDIAPGASLAFASGDDDQQAFANAVTALTNAGCKVIVDDLGYFDEPYFQPGIIEQSINSAVAAGVTYLSAAGNSGTNGFLQAANFVTGTLPDGTTGDLLNFNPGGTAATRMQLTIVPDPFNGSLGSEYFEWDDPFTGVPGTVQSDLDIYFYNASGTTIVYSGTDNNFNTGEPFEQLLDANGQGTIAAGTYQVEIAAKNTVTASLPHYIEFTGTASFGTVQYTGTRASIIGHNGGQNVISVGAVAWYDVPTPENAGTLIPSEIFSSAGPIIRSRDVNGALLPSAITLEKPDISATDGNNTSFFPEGPGQDITQDPDSLPNFFGTSSAVGNAGAVVALLLQINPALTSSQIDTILQSTAVPVNAQAQGSYDNQAGFGLIDADLAAALLTTSSSGGGGGGGPIFLPPVATIDSVVPNPTSLSINTLEIDFSEAVTGFDLADLTFSYNGGPNLLTGAQSLTTTDNTIFFLNNLAPLDSNLGTYTLTLNASGSGIENTQGEALVLSTSNSFTKIKLLKLPAGPSNLVATGVSQGSIRLNWRDNSVDETNFVVQQSNNADFTSKVKSYTLPANTTSLTLGNLPVATRYYYRVYATSANGQSDFSNTDSDFTFTRGEIILDDTSTTGVKIAGDWTSSTDVPGYFGSDYLQDDDAGKGDKTVTYTPNLRTYTDYFIYARWTRSTDRATKVPFSIYSEPGQLLATVFANERSTGGSGWVLLGKFKLHGGTLSSVQISNDTPGTVVADAVQFLPAAELPPAATSSAKTANASVIKSSTFSSVPLKDKQDADLATLVQ